jgi:hypothetical protein
VPLLRSKHQSQQLRRLLPRRRLVRSKWVAVN